MNYILIIHQATLLNKLFNDTIISLYMIIFAVVLLDGLINKKDHWNNKNEFSKSKEKQYEMLPY